jgi:predicted sulfurtransferase
MKNYEVIIFYKYCHVTDPDAIILWQTELCKRLNLVGRIIIADEGINGTLCGTADMTKKYIRKTKQYELFSDIVFKKSLSDFIAFDSLKVKKKEEIVILREDKKEISFSKSEPKIDRDSFHSILEGQNTEFTKENMIILDTRNSYESRIGKFQGAICPTINTSRDFGEYFKKNKDIFKNKKIIMYCTAGVRCERISVLCRTHTDAKEIYHLEHGIHTYCEKYPDGHFRGRNYVFDDRISIKINNDILTKCDHCGVSCDLYNNCLNALCNLQYISCDQCLKKNNSCCSDICQKKVNEKTVPTRPPLKSRQCGIDS